MQMSTDYIPQGLPAVLSSYMPSLHGVRNLDDLAELFLTTHSRILAESNSRAMGFLDQEKQLRQTYDAAIGELEQQCKDLRDQLHQMMYRRESAIRSLYSDRDAYQEEVKTHLLMLDVWLRDNRKRFAEQQKRQQEVEL